METLQVIKVLWNKFYLNLVFLTQTRSLFLMIDYTKN